MVLTPNSRRVIDVCASAGWKYCANRNTKLVSLSTNDGVAGVCASRFAPNASSISADPQDEEEALLPC